MRRLAAIAAAASLVVAAGCTGSRMPSGWARLANPPIERSYEARVWDGRGLSLWGGFERGGGFRADGAYLDAHSGRWSPIPPAPLAGRADAGAVWTGRRLLVWGGWAGQRLFADGAAYEPSSRRWRRLPPAPLSPRVPLAAVWTGRELVVWGDRSRTPGASLP